MKATVSVKEDAPIRITFRYEGDIGPIPMRVNDGEPIMVPRELAHELLRLGIIEERAKQYLGTGADSIAKWILTGENDDSE